MHTAHMRAFSSIYSSHHTQSSIIPSSHNYNNSLHHHTGQEHSSHTDHTQKHNTKCHHCHAMPPIAIANACHIPSSVPADCGAGGDGCGRGIYAADRDDAIRKCGRYCVDEDMGLSRMLRTQTRQTAEHGGTMRKSIDFARRYDSTPQHTTSSRESLL